MDLSFNIKDISISIPILIGLISFLIYWFTYQSDQLQSFFKKKYGQEKGQANFILFKRFIGGFCMGVLPAISYYLFIPHAQIRDMGLILKTDMTHPFIFWLFLLILLIFPLVYFNVKKTKNLLVYPQIRNTEWNSQLLFYNFFSWAWYLLGYEILFRGILLFPLNQYIGIWPAIAVNIALYSATHLPKGYKETLGAIPFSIILCILCLYTGSFWIAFFAHLTMAWTNAWFSLKHNPDMRIIKIKANESFRIWGHR